MGIIGREGSQGFPLGWKDPEPAVPRAGPLHCCLPVSWRIRLHLPCRRGRRGTRRDALEDPGRRDLRPRGQHQPGACPSPPQPSSWPMSGLSLQSGAVQPWERGSCWHRPHPLGWETGWGGWNGTPGLRSAGTGLQAWLIHHPWVPLWIRGSELERRAETSRCTQSLLWRQWRGGALGWES